MLSHLDKTAGSTDGAEPIDEFLGVARLPRESEQGEGKERARGREGGAAVKREQGAAPKKATRRESERD